jgi:hypothetical protein
VRIVISISVPLLLALILVRGRAPSELASWLGVAQWALVGASIVVAAAGFAWARRARLEVDQALRLMFGPTLTSPAWETPAFTRLLAPASGKVREPESTIPSDYLRAIRDMLPYIRVSGSDPGRAALETAERLLSAINHRDAELATLSRDAGPDEERRLVSQLDALDTRGTGDTAERIELRELVQHQLDIIRRMQGRREVILTERAHFTDLFRALWALVRAAGDTMDDQSRVIDRLHALCTEIRTEVGAAAVETWPRERGPRALP